MENIKNKLYNDLVTFEGKKGYPADHIIMNQESFKKLVKEWASTSNDLETNLIKDPFWMGMKVYRTEDIGYGEFKFGIE